MKMPLEEEHVYSAGQYHPYRLPDGSKNPSIDRLSRWIMDTKEASCAGHGYAVNAFGDMFATWTDKIFEPSDNLLVAIVPSSTAGKIKHGLEGIVAKGNPKLIQYERDLLVRHTSSKAAHLGGARSIAVHMNSLRVDYRLDGTRPILLLDDVKATGSSLTAAEQLLRDAGATTVYKLVLGELL